MHACAFPRGGTVRSRRVDGNDAVKALRILHAPCNGFLTPCRAHRSCSFQLRERNLLCKSQSSDAATPETATVPPCSTLTEYNIYMKGRTHNIDLRDLMQCFKTLVKLAAGVSFECEDDRKLLAKALVLWTTASQEHLKQLTSTSRAAAGILGALAGIAAKQPLAAASADDREWVASWTLQVLKRVQDQLQEAAPSEYLYILTGSALLAPARADPSWLAALEAATFSKLSQFSADQLAGCIWAMDKLAPLTGWQPGAEWLNQFLNAAQPHMEQFSTADLAAMLAALARFGAFPSEKWLDAVIVVLQRRAPSMSAAEVAMLSYACEALGIPLDQVSGTPR